ncbi:MAG: arylesterase [Candidatus Methylumidiphilus sp.]
MSRHPLNKSSVDELPKCRSLIYKALTQPSPGGRGLSQNFHMMKTWLLLMVLLVGCGSGIPKLKPLPPDAVILAFGDSLTYGTGATAEESYPAVLQTLVGRTVIRSGIPGEATAESLQRLPDVLDEFSPKLMILCIGGNDFLRQLGEQQAADNIRAMIKLAKEKGMDVVLVGVPKFGLMLSPPTFYREIAAEFAIPYDDGIMRKVLLSPDLKSDEIHPNAKGYRLFAETVANLLKKAGAI